MPLGPNSALSDWHSMRRPPIAAAWECCPLLPRTAAVADVTKRVPLPRSAISGQTAHAKRNRPEGAEPPAHFKGPVAGVLKRPVANLGAEVVHRHFDRADVGLDGRHPLLNGVLGYGVEQEARGGTTLAFNAINEPLQTLLVAAAAQGTRGSRPRRSADPRCHRCRHRLQSLSKLVSRVKHSFFGWQQESHQR